MKSIWFSNGIENLIVYSNVGRGKVMYGWIGYDLERCCWRILNESWIIVIVLGWDCRWWIFVVVLGRRMFLVDMVGVIVFFISILFNNGFNFFVIDMSCVILVYFLFWVIKYKRMFG